MSLDTQHGKFIFICDDCGDDHNTNESEFFEALNRIKEEGWLVTRDNADEMWIHICKECTDTNRAYMPTKK